eukprot:1299876-Pyramimonas_sp.AAC.1
MHNFFKPVPALPDRDAAAAACSVTFARSACGPLAFERCACTVARGVADMRASARCSTLPMMRTRARDGLRGATCARKPSRA